MSVEVSTWAFQQKAPSSSAKFVLIALANNARAEDGCAWPSIGYLCDATQQDRKTVISNLAKLAEVGLIAGVGKTGKTQQVNVYQLAIKGAAPGEKRNGSETGTVPVSPSNSTGIPSKQSRISAERVPKTGHGTVMEPSKEPSGNRQRREPPATVDVSLLVEAGIDREVAIEFIAHKARLKAPLTARAWVDHVREAERAGWTPQQAAEKVMARSWKGFEAKYVANERPPAAAGAESFRERDQRAAAEEAARWGGRAARRRDVGPCVDVEEARYVAADES